jgi:hypothetical protein
MIFLLAPFSIHGFANLDEAIDFCCLILNLPAIDSRFWSITSCLQDDRVA